jgi:hypothetical protein
MGVANVTDFGAYDLDYFESRIQARVFYKWTFSPEANGGDFGQTRRILQSITIRHFVRNDNFTTFYERIMLASVPANCKSAGQVE